MPQGGDSITIELRLCLRDVSTNIRGSVNGPAIERAKSTRQRADKTCAAEVATPDGSAEPSVHSTDAEPSRAAFAWVRAGNSEI